MSFSRQELTVNIDTMRVIRSATDKRPPLRVPTFYANETSVLCVSLVDNDGAVVVLDAGDEFEAAVHVILDNSDTVDVMAYSDDTQVDIAGDWDDIDRASGKISIRLACTRDEFFDSITDSDGDQDCYLQIRRVPNGETNSSTVLQDTALAISAVISKYVM